MAHQHYIEDNDGDLIDVIVFCSDFCHQSHAGDDYAGWNGCQEVEFDTVCAQCGEKIEGFSGEYSDYDDSPTIEKIRRNSRRNDNLRKVHGR